MDAHSLDCLEFSRIRELLAGCALTGLGRCLAEKTTPSTRPDVIARWLDQLRELQRYETNHGLPPMAGITDVRDLVRRCAPPLQVGVEEILRIGDALAGTRAICRYAAGLDENYPQLHRLAQRIGDFGSVADRIRGVIDDRGHVRSDATPRLSRIRAEIESCSQQIRIAMDRLLRVPEVRRCLQYANHTLHDDRWVLPVKTEHRGRIPGIIHRHSDSGATIYVEPSQAVELNNLISRLRLDEAEEISRIVWELAHEVHLNGEAILRTLDALAVLDLAAAKARFAKAFELRCPDLCEQPSLKLRQARHPLLLELAHRRRQAGEPTATVVPIDCRLGEDFDLLVITGPNTGGKTATLKTVGLLVLMLQSGLPVPVDEGSVFGVFDRVLIDIGDEQSLAQSLSTFSAHLRRQLDMLAHAGPRSLVLIDELGAGTDPDEGAAIGTALLDELLRLQSRCIATTHLGSLKRFALTRDRAENGCVDFDVETLRPTYHLRIGEPGMSNAIAIAQHLGMPRRLIASARNNLSGQARHLHHALQGTIEAKRQAESARRNAETAALDASRAANEAADARRLLDRQRADFEQWVRSVVHLRPGDPVRVRNFDRDGSIVRIRLDQQRAEVDIGAFAVEVPLGDLLPPETPAPPAPPARVRPTTPPAAKPPHTRPPPQQRAAGAAPPRDTERERVGPTPLSEAQLAALAPGDRVYVKRFHRAGAIVRLLPTKRTALVSVGALELEVPYSGLAAPRPDSPDRRSGKPGARSKPAAPPPESTSAAPDGDASGRSGTGRSAAGGLPL